MAEQMQPSLPVGMRAELAAMERLHAARQAGDKRQELAAMMELSGLVNSKEHPDDPLAPKRVDTETGAPAGVRAAASIKASPAGKQGYLESVYGQGNVAQRQDGEFFYRKNPTDKWTQFDEAGLSGSDFADMAGGAIEVGPAVGVGLTTANPFAIGAAGAAGNAARQGVSAMLPGDDQMTPVDRVASAATTGVMTGLGQLGVNALAKGVDAIRPHNVIARSVQRSMESPIAKRGQTLSRQTGIEFSPGQLSGSKGQLTVEGLARRHPASADKVQQFDEYQTNTAHKLIKSIQDKMNPQKSGPFTAGTEVSKTFDNAVSNSVKARSSQWEKDFAPVLSYAGDHKIFPLNATRSEIAKIADDFDVPGGGDMSAALVNRLKGIQTELDKPLSAKQTQRLLQIYGKVARGEGQIFKDIDKGQQRAIAGRIVSAIQKDLDDFAEGGAQGSAIVDALRNARSNWRQNSQAINELEDSVLGRMLGGKSTPAPENIAEKFMRMRSSEIKAAAKILDSRNPEAMNLVRSHMLEMALKKSSPAGSAADQFAISPAKFNSYLKSNAEQFQSAFLASGKNKELGHLKHAYEALGRLANRAGTDGSPTAPLMMAWDMASSAFTANPVGLARNAVTILAPRKVAKIMSTEEGRQALITLSRVSPKTKAYGNAAAAITAILSKDDQETKSAAESYFKGGNKGGQNAETSSDNNGR